MGWLRSWRSLLGWPRGGARLGVAALVLAGTISQVVALPGGESATPTPSVPTPAPVIVAEAELRLAPSNRGADAPTAIAAATATALPTSTSLPATSTPAPTATPTAAPTAVPTVAPSATPVPPPPPAPAGPTRTVVLDPGHAGRWSGATTRLADGRQLLEKDLNLKVGLRTAELLRQAGVKVVLTRTNDGEVAAGRDRTGDGAVTLNDDLQARVDVANQAGADAFISIHFNGGNTGFKGTEVFYNANRPFSAQSRALATTIYDRLLAAIRGEGYNPVERGVKRDAQATGGAPFFILSPAGGSVVRASQMPSALGEPLFLTEPKEAALLADDAFLTTIAQAYAQGILDYLATL
ncbi:MAG: N-acetylmuramoyl-L-alanine amidase family protein [Chloroflexota bacterium]